MDELVRSVSPPDTRLRVPAQSRWSSRVTVGARIRNARLAAGLTAAEVAEGLTTPAYLSQLETGERWPSRLLLAGIADVVGVSVEELALDHYGSPTRAGLPFELAHADLLLGTAQFSDAVQVATDLGDIARCIGAHDVADAAEIVRARALIALGDTEPARAVLRALCSRSLSIVGHVATAQLHLAEQRFDAVVDIGSAVVKEHGSGPRLSCPEVAVMARTVCQALAAVGEPGTAAYIARIALRHLDAESGAAAGAGSEGEVHPAVTGASFYRSFEQVVRNAERDVAAIHASRQSSDSRELRSFAAAGGRRTDGELARWMAV